MNPVSLRTSARLANTDATDALQLADGPHCLFSRIRLWIAGTVVEDIDNYGRSRQLFRRILMPKEWTVNDAIESGLQSYREGAVETVMPHVGKNLGAQ